MAERADQDVAVLDLGHAAARELERVVAGLVVQHLDRDQNAFLARYFLAHADLLAEIGCERDRRDLVDEHRAHVSSLRPGCGTYRAAP